MASRKFGFEKSIQGDGHSQSHGTSVEELFRSACQTAEQLHERLRTGVDVRGCFLALRMILDAIPLARNEYALQRCRLLNADRYQLVGERQAAAYEIELLAKRLRAELARSVA